MKKDPQKCLDGASEDLLLYASIWGWDQLVGETLESMCIPRPAVWAETSEER